MSDTARHAPPSEPSVAPLVEGSALDSRYVLHERVAQGAFADVWRATDIMVVEGRSVAVKVARDATGARMLGEEQAVAERLGERSFGRRGRTGDDGAAAARRRAQHIRQGGAETKRQVAARNHRRGRFGSDLCRR